MDPNVCQTGILTIDTVSATVPKSLWSYQCYRSAELMTLCNGRQLLQYIYIFVITFLVSYMTFLSLCTQWLHFHSKVHQLRAMPEHYFVQGLCSHSNQTLKFTFFSLLGSPCLAWAIVCPCVSTIQILFSCMLLCVDLAIFKCVLLWSTFYIGCKCLCAWNNFRNAEQVDIKFGIVEFY